ncbi:ABC transporter substrate-binding protein [Actinotalea sp.]|uniref:ABC transporter substrate-binding protein n=1 Tax=Actinotalea sp. TaxID=1872145 RepID=UPI0035694561
MTIRPRAAVRRAAAALTALGVLGALAACAPGAEPAASTQSQVEVFTWWASGSEKLASDVLTSAFRRANPEIEFIHGGVAGGAGSAAKDVLASRMANGDPPDSFQVHGGAELAEQIAAGEVSDLTALYADLGLDRALPQVVLDLVSADGIPYAVPTNVHRANLVWSNPSVLADSGIDPLATFATLDEWFVALDRVRASGHTPLVLGAPWTQVHLLEQVLLSRLGPAGYTALWDGSGDSAEVTAAIEDYARLLGYANPDRDALDWSDCADRLDSGEAAFLVMGDWAAQLLRDPIGWQPFPGTDGVDDIVVDGFAQAVGAPDPENARLWLATVAAPDVQIAFADAKGAAPARSDIPSVDLGTYPRRALESLRTDEIVLSLAHGGVTTPQALAELTAVVGRLGRGQASTSEVQESLTAAARAWQPAGPSGS